MNYAERLEGNVDELHTTDTELVERAPEQEAGAAGEGGKACEISDRFIPDRSKLWTCGRCRTQFRVGAPSFETTARGNCSEPGCGRRIWWTSDGGGQKTVIGVFSIPVPFEGKAI